MGDTKFTFVELHLDGDTQFGPGSIGSALPFGSSDESEETPEYEPESDLEESDEDSGSGKAIGTVVALAVLVAIAVAAKKFRGDDDEAADLEAEDEPDVIVN